MFFFFFKKKTAYEIYKCDWSSDVCSSGLTTFSLRTAPYQSLRRGGITGAGACGAIKAGELILGEFLGDPDPAGAVTPGPRAASEYYR